MTTTTKPVTTYRHRPTSKVCAECKGTGVIFRQERPVIGHKIDGTPIYHALPRSYGYACQCRTGWPKVSAR